MDSRVDNGASEVPATILETSDGINRGSTEDPFGLNSNSKKQQSKSDVIREVNDENPSLKYPPSFTPSVEKNGSKSKDDQVEREDNRNSDGAKTNSTGSRKFKMSEIPRTGGSILSVMEEIVKVGPEEVPLGGSAILGANKIPHALTTSPPTPSTHNQSSKMSKLIVPQGETPSFGSRLRETIPKALLLIFKGRTTELGLIDLIKGLRNRNSFSTYRNRSEEVQNQGVNIFDYIRIKIGNGDNTSFWKDKWHNEGVLKDVFPRLYALERHQNVTYSHETD
ncbi:hypothetical protein Tco_0116438 [Tanacetum coccineum]